MQTVLMMSLQYVRMNISGKISAAGHVSCAVTDIKKSLYIQRTFDI